MKDNKKKSAQIRADKFGYTEDDIKGVKLIKSKKKVKESYSSFAEFLFEREEKFVASTMRWITIKDERDRNQHILIKKKDGTIIAGMGGEHNGKKLDQAFKDIAVDKKEIEKKEEPREERRRTSQLLTKALSNTKILNDKEVKKYVTAFKKDAIKGSEYHSVMDITHQDINKDQRISLNVYSGSSYSIMNRLLRDPDFYDEKLHPNRLSEEQRKQYEKYIEDCYTALKKNKSTEAVVTYRGVKSELMEQLKEASPGDIITDDGFVSSSTSKKVAENFASKYSGGYIMNILIPKGSQAASIKGISNFPKENEVLINKKARFEIKGIDHEKKEMIVELLPHEEE